MSFTPAFRFPRIEAEDGTSIRSYRRPSDTSTVSETTRCGTSDSSMQAHLTKFDGKRDQPDDRPNSQLTFVTAPIHHSRSSSEDIHTRTSSQNDDDDQRRHTGDPEKCIDALFAMNGDDDAASVLTFPEGGLWGWLVVLGAFCAMFSVFGLINSAAVFESYFAANQLKDYSPSQLGWIFSLYLFLVFFVGLQVGPIFDRYGPRWPVAVGSTCMVASLMLLGFCTKYYQILLTYSVLGGLGGAMMCSPAYGSIAHWFDRRRGLATGIAVTAGGIGGIVFPIMLQHLLPQLGFAWSTRILGCIMLGLAIPANLLIRARLPPKRNSQKCSSVWPDFTIFRDPRYAFCAVGIFFTEWGLFIPITFIVSYAAANGQDTNASYVLLSLLNVGSVIGRFLPGLLADKLGRFNITICTVFLCAASVLGLWLPAGQSHGIIIAFALVFGFASGSNLSLVPVCIGQLCDSRDYARYTTTANFVASFGTLSSVPIGGALLGMGQQAGGNGWLALMLFSGWAYILALSCYVTARVLAVGWSLRKKY